MTLANIERLVVGDEGRLRAVRLRALEDAPDAFGTTFDEAGTQPLAAWRRQLEQSATFVATAGDCDVGIARGAADDDLDDTAWLLSMWVAPEMRRRGIAAALVDTVIAWARTEGFRRLVLDVAETNEAALVLYAAKGFVANGTLGALPPPRQHVRERQLERTL
ncbi:MAG TPA: GNAT family N-acetyltransferase [Pirellulales bacterium]|nr:GNAT family N-acetyltransferase [Pirellulales bacterium]